MKIAFISPMASSLIAFRKNLVIDLVAQGHEVFCCATDFTTRDKKLLSEWGAVSVDYDLSPRGMNPFKDILATWKLSRILRKLELDIVMPFFVKPVIFGTIAARLANVPRIVGMIEGLGNAFTCSEMGFSRKAKIIQKIQVFLYKIALPKLDVLIVLNPDDKKDLIDTYQIPVKEMIILGGIGVDLSEYLYSPVDLEHPVSFIFIARLLREKGIFEYLEAAEKIKGDYPNINFYVLGSLDIKNTFGLKQDELNSYLRKNIVIHPGHVNNVPEWIEKSSIFVLPSFYREGVPRSTQEAMAIGRPIITTDSVGCRETVEDGINGFLIPPFSATALVEKMIFFIENPEEINKMGTKSREMAENRYDVKKINQRLIGVLLGEVNKGGEY